MLTNHSVGLSESPINLQNGYDFVRSNTSGAITSFIGTTRDNFDGKKVRIKRDCGYIKVLIGKRIRWDWNYLVPEIINVLHS